MQADICGVGGGDLSSGPSYAIVIQAGCADVPTDTTATHELLHALGSRLPSQPRSGPFGSRSTSRRREGEGHLLAGVHQDLHGR